MFRKLLYFEWQFFGNKKSFYLLLLCFTVLGFFTGTAAHFPFPGTFKNGTYVLSYLMGILSLLGIFTTTLLTAITLFREKESRFDALLYSTPIRKAPYVLSRFSAVFLISLLCYLLLTLGLMAGHLLHGSHTSELDTIRPARYLHPFLTLLLPNLFFCTAVAVSIGLWTRNKMLVYVSGVFIYFLYWGISFYTHSPLVANNMPMPAASMHMAALTDPFGISAFFEQTRYWNAFQRNQQFIRFNGSVAVNRLAYLALSCILLYLAYRRFGFTPFPGKACDRKEKAETTIAPPYKVTRTVTSSFTYTIASLRSLTRIQVSGLLRSIALWLIFAGWSGYLSVEICSQIDGNLRIPEQLTTTAVIVKCVLSDLPLTAMLALLFFGNEICWRSRNARFHMLEQSTALKPSVTLISRWLSLLPVVVLLLLASIVTGVMLQLIKGNAPVDWRLYAGPFYLIGLPLLLNAGLIVVLHTWIPNKYAGMAVTGAILLLAHTSVGKVLGAAGPLLPFVPAFRGAYSEMNGYSIELTAFHYRMLYGLCATLLLLALTLTLRPGQKKTMANGMLCLLLLTGTFFFGYTLQVNNRNESPESIALWKTAFERRYSFLRNRSQPVITTVKTHIDLYPENAAYKVRGSYMLVNKTSQAIDTIYLYGDKEMQWGRWQLEHGTLIASDPGYGYYIFKPDRPMKPMDSLKLEFRFSYRRSPFSAAAGFNTIIRNGSFIRISRYFPSPGYQAGNEIEDPRERRQYGLDTLSRLKALSAPRESDPTFISLDATISAPQHQTAIGIGELTDQWQQDGRSYFRYRTGKPVPFRFAVAAAAYAVRKVKQGKVQLEFYYDPSHSRNIGHLVRNARRSLAYCEQYFGPYPFATVRFVEIASLTRGFAGTAYPGSLFINESFGYRNIIEGNPEKDIINEMVSHELSHAWWGNSGIAPDEREGSSLLTETLAMYTELMCYKQMYGASGLVDRVKVHKDIYLSSRSGDREPPLYRLNPALPHLAYDKGMVAMYQLYLMLGEERLNKALRQFYTLYAYPGKAPVTTDLLQELYAVALPAENTKIDELFREIVTYDLIIDKTSVTAGSGNMYRLDLQASVKKYEEDGNGRAVALPFNGLVEAAIYLEGGQVERRTLSAVQNRLRATLAFTRKPMKVVLDPDLRFLNRSDEEKEAKL